MHPRPDHHFTPPQNWMNDPNGLIFHEGLYHLYYQHNPVANVFGNISWGHATSRDLMAWEHHPVALHATNEAMMYSGCVVRDKQDQLCAIYTEHEGNTERYRERICLAESKDGGFTFDQDKRAILLEHSSSDFRDPKVFWHEASASWIMCVALPREFTILFYRSTDLQNWQICSEFSSRQARGQFWECPDLFALKNEAGEEVWILGISGENVDGASWGMFYFTGTFDGKTFSAEVGARPLDFGSDFYAGITFEGLQEKVMIGWCGNWAYANEIETKGWRGMMSSPRKLTFRNGQLCQSLISAKASE